MKFLALIVLLFSTQAFSHALKYHPPIPQKTIEVGHEELDYSSPLKVIAKGHPTLRKIAEEYPEEELQSKKAQSFIDDMFKTMKHYGGVGLAAPQVNVSQRMFVMKSGREYVTVINPEIEYLTDYGTKQSREGCLSIPGKRYTVPRYKRLDVKYTNRYGERIHEEVGGFPAIIIQHEFDHLEGILISDFGFDIFGFEDENIPLM